MNPTWRFRAAGGDAAGPATPGETAFGCPRDTLGNRFVYTVISPRARGLSVGVDMNPDKRCNFDCVYCETDRSTPGRETALDVRVMAAELERTLLLAHSGKLRERYRDLPEALLKVRHVALSGQGEPTHCPQFAEAAEAVALLRASGRLPSFPMVLITNGAGLDRPEVEEGLVRFGAGDEIWVKLEAGTQAYMDRVNRPDCTLDEVFSKTLRLARRRPVVIQSLFPRFAGEPPPPAEIEAFAVRLRDLREAGAIISSIQVYSATRPTARSECGHLPLRALSQIARRLQEVSGIPAEVF